MIEQNVKPAYQVERLEGMIEIKKAFYNRAGQIDYKTEEVPAGYMVYFPSGNSIRIKDDEGLQKLGFDVPPELVDMDSGDTVSAPKMKARNVDLKAESIKNTKPSTKKE